MKKWWSKEVRMTNGEIIIRIALYQLGAFAYIVISGWK